MTKNNQLGGRVISEAQPILGQRGKEMQPYGGVAIAMGGDVAELTHIEKPPRGREEVPVQVSRLLEAHEHILTQAPLVRAEGSSSS